MIQQRIKQEVFVKPGAPQREEMLTIQVKNTVLHLNGQNLRLAAKNGCDSKTPGLHLSAAHGKEAAGRLTACSPTHEATAQLDMLLLKPPRPDLEREAKSQPVRRPQKLAPLELPKEVKEAQRQKLQLQQEARPVSRKQDRTVNEPHARTARPGARPSQAKAEAPPSASASASAKAPRAQQQNRPFRPKLTCSNLADQNGAEHLMGVMCQGTPAPQLQRNKPAPPLLAPRVKARAACGAGEACQNPGTQQQEAGRRRLWLRRAQRVEEDQCNSNTSTGGLSADKDRPHQGVRLVQGVQGRGQREERAPRSLPHPGKGIKEPPGNTEASGRAIKRIAVSNLRDAL